MKEEIMKEEIEELETEIKEVDNFTDSYWRPILVAHRSDVQKQIAAPNFVDVVEGIIKDREKYVGALRARIDQIKSDNKQLC